MFGKIKEQMKRNKKKLLVVSLIGGVIWVSLALQSANRVEPEPVSFNEFSELLAEKKVDSVELDLKSPTFTFVGKDDVTYITENPKNEGFKRSLLESDADIKEVKLDGENLLLTLFLNLLQVVLFVGAFLYLQKGAGGKSKHKILQAGEGIPGLTFASIAGNEEAKEEMKMLVDFLKKPEQFKGRGAVLPKGAIFYGPPGTGKTLMAKAIAGEAGVPFLSVNGSDFVELYVGNGPKRVRELFQEAKKVSPCIVFIDEIDSVGGKRGSNGNSEDNKTINALLSQLDGFDGSEQIVVIAATNRLEDLDTALIRPGRFDKQIAINQPDKEDRLAILNVHAKGKTFDKGVDMKQWANSTLGFAGADLSVLLNEATILSVLNKHEAIMESDMEDAYYKMVMKGHKKKNQDGRNRQDLKIVAWHEAGHAVVAKLIGKNSVPKVSIISSTSGAGGVTFVTPHDTALPSKRDLTNRIQMLYAGRIGEYLLLKDSERITSGASQDINEATKLIKRMLTEFGMSAQFGMLNLNVLQSGEKAEERMIDEATTLSMRLYNETQRFLEANIHTLERVADALLDKETLSEHELDDLLYPTQTLEEEQKEAV